MLLIDQRESPRSVNIWGIFGDHKYFMNLVGNRVGQEAFPRTVGRVGLEFIKWTEIEEIVISTKRCPKKAKIKWP